MLDRPWMTPCLGLLLCVAGQALAAPQAAGVLAEPGGVVVENVAEGFAAHKAGLQPGDVLLQWQRAASPPANPEPANGAIDSPFDLLEVEVEQAPRGELTLSGTRAGVSLLVRLSPGRWKLQSRPQLIEGEFETYEQARALIGMEKTDEGLSLWKEMASAFAASGDHLKASWLYLRVANTAGEGRNWEIAKGAFEAAQREAKASGEASVLARITHFLARAFRDQSQLGQASAAYQEELDLRLAGSSESLSIAENLNDLGAVARSRGDLEGAEDFYRRSLAMGEKLAPQSLDVARGLNNLGTLATIQGDLEAAEDYHRLSLAIKEQLAPQSLDVAYSLNNLGAVASYRGDLASAEHNFRRSLAIREKLAPHGLDVSYSLQSLGVVAWQRGDLASAEDHLRRSLAIQEKVAPNSLNVAGNLNNLGEVARYRGDLASAEHYIRRSLAIQEKFAPNSLDVAGYLNNLGKVASNRGDLASAEQYYRRSLAIQEKLAPNSLDVARSFNNFGIVASNRGDLASAEHYYRRSLAIQEKVAPNSLDVASGLNNLGELALNRGELASAEDYLRRSLAMREKLAPRSVDAADTLHHLGDVALARADLDSAESRYERALVIRRERAPGSAAEAESCQRLAALRYRRGSPDQALDFYGCAIDALESQIGKLGGSDEIRSGFGAEHAGIYREAIDLLVEVGKNDEAFHLLERYRARELRALLAHRDLVFSADLPEELEGRRRSANESYDRGFEQWMQLSHDVGAEQRKKAREELETMRRRQDEIRAEIRAASPRLAALQDPQPLDLKATHAALDPGTLLLSYSIGEQRSFLFAVGPQKGALRVVPLAVGEEWLRGEVESLREALSRGRVDPRPEKALLHARELSEQLLAPVSAQIREAKRLLILADGPLHSMPFAALTDPGAIGQLRFLVEAKPIHLAASATVFALLKGERRELHERREPRLTAFGDPLFPAAALGDEQAAPQLRAALRNGFDFARLPATRAEVESLQRLYPQDSRIYLGAEATEGKAKAVGKETTLLHIACHGLLDDRFPLDSALALSIPLQRKEGEDNGLLQAWEIFEQVRIDADLVTLSACNTGRGKVLGGEGLIGLTRAFQYAGARSVFASLWSVSDASTPELMKRFYGYLKAGKSKAEALRSAQLDLLRSSDHSHPFHWAGFQLVGDWR